ncbi:T9SS type A sorting domain-containing protein [candidate division WOR-3 bacterium]|nr:T9SS type A sorting domain-containing protein [candidate division WOR-3 bacterium]
MRKILIIFLISLFGRTIPLLAEGEFLVDTSIVYVPAPNHQLLPSIAFDGTNYFVVWQHSTGIYRIYGARVSQSGRVLDPSGIIISSVGGHLLSPSIAFDGTNYFVVWDSHGHGIYGTRISPSGTILDTPSVQISNAPNTRTPRIAFDGTNYLVVWRQSSDIDNGKPDIYSARVTPEGVVLDTSGIPICTALNTQLHPSVAFDGTNYLVVWQDIRDNNYYDIYGARVSREGTVLDPLGIPISIEACCEESPSVAFDGINYFVVWEDRRSLSSYDIYGARVSQEGTVLDTQNIPICIATDHQQYPSIAFNGTNYLVVWEDWRSGGPPYNIYGTRVSQSGTVLDPSGIAVSTVADTQQCPSIAFDGTNYLVVWQDERNGDNYDIYATRVLQSGVVLDTLDIRISGVPNSQTHPSVAFDSTNYLVVWQDERNGDSYNNYEIYGARISQSGTVLDTISIGISIATDWQVETSIAFDGTNYLVVWNDWRGGSYSHDIYGARVSQLGTALDTSGIAVSTAASFPRSPSVAFDGTNYLVVWDDYRSGSDYDIYGVRISQSGTVLDTSSIPISTTVNGQESPSIAFDGTNYFVVWADWRDGSYSYDIYGARVSQLGIVLDTSGIPISTAVSSQRYPSIGFDGTNYLVVWQDYRNGSDYDIYGTRVSRDGGVLDTGGIAICIAPAWQSRSSVVFDGTNYIVVWEDDRNSDWDIYGIRLSTSGTAIDSFVVSTQLGNQRSPALSKCSDGKLLIAYSGWTPEINGKPANTMRIWGKFYPFTGVEEQKELRVESKELRVFPNPFNKKAMINYQLPAKGRVSLKIYDLAGRLVKALVDKEVKTGKHTIKWDGKDLQGRKVSSGIYFCKMEAGDFKAIKKLVILK